MFARGLGELRGCSRSRIFPKNSLRILSTPFTIRRCQATAVERVFQPSKEQLAVVQAVETNNVLVMARPGAGKTATGEAVIAAFPDVPIAVVTYSKRLQLDNAERLAIYPNADVFTFHGLAGRLFGQLVPDHIALLNLRMSGALPVWAPNYEILILDELQDLTPDLYWFTCVLIATITRRLRRAPRIINLGDPRQAIYQFRGADARYLQLSETTFSTLSPYGWQDTRLAKSFRLSYETAGFVNAFIGEKYIEGSHSGPKPLYVLADIFKAHQLLKVILPLIKQYGPARSAIIAPSVRHSPFLPLLTNALTKGHGIPVAIPTSDDAPLDPDVLYGKVVVATYHQFKGSERDLVIVYRVDDGYFQVLGRDLPDDRCPNAMFVALTRASKQLVVIQSQENPAVPFMSWEAMNRTAKFINLTSEDPKPQRPPGRPLQLGLLLPREIFVTDVVRHVDHEVVEDLVKRCLRIEKVSTPLPESRCINVVDKVLTDVAKNHYETVSDLSGLAVTAAFEWDLIGQCSTYRKSPDRLSQIPKDATKRARWFAKEAAIYHAQASGYQSRHLQMKRHAFDWLDGHLDATTQRLAEQIKDLSRVRFEVLLKDKFTVEEKENKLQPLQTIHISGRADILLTAPTRLQPSAIWEIKFVSALLLEHAIQLAIYGYLYYAKAPTKKRKKPPFPELWLFNVRNGEKWRVVTDMGAVGKLIEGLLRAKYTSKGEIPTHSFLKQCEKIQKEVEDLEI